MTRECIQLSLLAQVLARNGSESLALPNAAVRPHLPTGILNRTSEVTGSVHFQFRRTLIV